MLLQHALEGREEAREREYISAIERTREGGKHGERERERIRGREGGSEGSEAGCALCTAPLSPSLPFQTLPSLRRTLRSV